MQSLTITSPLTKYLFLRGRGMGEVKLNGNRSQYKNIRNVTDKIKLTKLITEIVEHF